MKHLIRLQLIKFPFLVEKSWKAGLRFSVRLPKEKSILIGRMLINDRHTEHRRASLSFNIQHSNDLMSIPAFESWYIWFHSMKCMSLSEMYFFGPCTILHYTLYTVHCGRMLNKLRCIWTTNCNRVTNSRLFQSELSSSIFHFDSVANETHSKGNNNWILNTFVHLCTKTFMNM